MKKMIIVLTALLALTGCVPGLQTPVSAESLVPVTATSAVETHLACPICEIDMAAYDGPLTATEVEGLLLALNDEYHAWAVYDQVLQDHGDVRPFSSILQSEAKHISELVLLMETYAVPVPENPWIGGVPSFASVQAAAAAGVQAEVDNAALYDRINASTERADILKVYSALQAASLDKHLPAFERASTRPRRR